MEALFELIFGNIAFVIVVIGGIISFLKRASQGEQQKKKTVNRKSFNPQLDWPKIEIEQQKVDARKPKQTRQNTPRMVQANESIEVEVQTNPFYEKLSSMEPSSQDMIGNNNPFSVKKKSTVPTAEIDLNIRNINQKKVIEGILWGEILGPPRAKNKYSYQNKRI